MLVWRGWGILAILIPFGCIVILELMVGKPTYQSSPWYPTSGLMVGAVIVYLVGSWFDKRSVSRSREVIDTKTGEKFTLSHRNQFFFIDMKWWSIIVAVFAIIFFISN